jgi:hypothetical protein
MLLGAFVLGGALVLGIQAILGGGSTPSSKAVPARAGDATPPRAGAPTGSPGDGNPKASSRRVATGEAPDTWSVPSGAATAFKRFERSLPGPIGIVVTPIASSRAARFGPLQSGHAWSTMKVPVLVTYERQLAAQGRTLDSQDRDDATLAIEQSDNASIDAVFSRLETLAGGLVAASGEIEQTLKDSGDPLTVVNTSPNGDGFSTFGQTDWSLTASSIFYKALAKGCLLDHARTHYVLNLMRHVTGSERWGAGEAGFGSGISVAFKGGWGPEPDGSYLVRQTAIIGSGGHGYVIAMLAHPPGAGSSSFAEGESMLTRIATWARRTFRLPDSHTTADCASR